MSRQGLGPAVALVGPALCALSLAGAGCQGCGRGPQEAAPPPAASDTSGLERRLAAVALREKAVELREKAVAEREAKLQDALLTPTPLGGAPVVKPALPLAPARAAQSSHSQQQAEVAHRRVQNEMEAKGLLPADLPADAARLDEQIYAALRNASYDQAVDLSDRLGRAVAAIQVDQSFLDAKMQRVAALRRQRQVAPGAATEIDSLLQEVTSLAADGQYGSANRRVNRIAAILQ